MEFGKRGTPTGVHRAQARTPGTIICLFFCIPITYFDVICICFKNSNLELKFLHMICTS